MNFDVLFILITAKCEAAGMSISTFKSEANGPQSEKGEVPTPRWERVAVRNGGHPVLQGFVHK